jgi:hypothetical protein
MPVVIDRDQSRAKWKSRNIKTRASGKRQCVPSSVPESRMSVSIYYTARRRCELSMAEQAGIARVIDRYSVKEQIEEYHRTGVGWNGEDLCLYAPPFDSPDVMIEGATKLPNTTEDVFWDAVRHWCQALSEIRRVLPDAVWDVHVDDHEIPWDELRQEFDPSL